MINISEYLKWIFQKDEHPVDEHLDDDHLNDEHLNDEHLNEKHLNDQHLDNENISLDISEYDNDIDNNSTITALFLEVEKTEHILNHWSKNENKELYTLMNETMETVLKNSKLMIEKTICREFLENQDIDDINKQCKYLTRLNNIYSYI